MKINWRATILALACAAVPHWASAQSVAPASAPNRFTAAPAAIPETWAATPLVPPARRLPADPLTVAPPTLAPLTLDRAPAVPVEFARPVGADEVIGLPASFETLAASGETQAPDEYSTSCGSGCLPPWIHRSGLFAELLYLRARDAEVSYVVPVDGGIVPPPVPPIQVGPVGVVDPDYTPSYRVGGTYACDDATSLVFTYSRFDTTTSDAQTVDAPLVLRSLVLHPGTTNAGSDFLTAGASLGIGYHLGDVDFRSVWDAGDCWAINYLVGARYAGLTQDLDARFGDTGSADRLLTNVNFDGGGIRVGLDAERHAACGLFIFGKTTASFVGGEFRTSYTQSNDLDGVLVDTSWKSGRLVTMLDLELGAGWQSACGRWRLSAGYVVSSWLNTVTTDQWIGAVQTNDFVGLGDTMTFDGLVGRLEYRF